MVFDFRAHGQSFTPELHEVAIEIMESASTCALITVDSQGRPRARTMDPFTPDNNFTVWLATNPNSRKVTQIKNNPRVTLYYIDSTSTGYVTIHGKAELIDDPKAKQEYWKADWADFYPDYPAGYLLIKVSADWLEVISEPHGIRGDSITWQPPAIHYGPER